MADGKLANSGINDERRASERNYKRMAREVTLTMKNNPPCIPHLHAKLEALGMIMIKPADASSPGNILPSRVAAAVMRRGSRAPLQPCPTGEGYFGARVYRVDRMTVQIMKKHVLSVAEPSALSQPNVSNWLKNMKDIDASKEACLQLIEFATGIDPGFETQGRFADIDIFHAHVQEEANLRGNRAAKLVLPPDYPSRGVYAIVAMSQD